MHENTYMCVYTYLHVYVCAYMYVCFACMYICTPLFIHSVGFEDAMPLAPDRSHRAAWGTLLGAPEPSGGWYQDRVADAVHATHPLSHRAAAQKTKKSAEKNSHRAAGTSSFGDKASTTTRTRCVSVGVCVHICVCIY